MTLYVSSFVLVNEGVIYLVILEEGVEDIVNLTSEDLTRNERISGQGTIMHELHFSLLNICIHFRTPMIWLGHLHNIPVITSKSTSSCGIIAVVASHEQKVAAKATQELSTTSKPRSALLNPGHEYLSILDHIYMTAYPRECYLVSKQALYFCYKLLCGYPCPNEVPTILW